MKLGIIRLYMGKSGNLGYYNVQEIGLAKALIKKQIKTDIFFMSDNKEVSIRMIKEGIRIIYIPAKKIGNHGIINPKFILDYNLDIVHLLSDNQLMVPKFIKFCDKNKIPVYNYVGTIYSDTNNKVKKKFLDILSQRNIKYFKKSMIIAKTMDVKNVLESNGVKNVKLIPVGLDLNIIPNINNSKLELRQEIRLPSDKKILIFVGRLEEYKNPLKAIEIMKELSKKSSNYYLVMIGKGSMKDKVIDLIDKYNLTNSIQIIEKIENSKIHNYYRASDIFVNLNDKEIFGMSILEAMYQECVVIAVKAPGPNFIIENNEDGIIIENFDYKTWAKKIEDVFEYDEIKFNSKNKILKFFNWDSIVELYLQLFKQL